ncbi:MAG: DisA bacterial checkpoint controller nucleotide-binding protein [Candidatus Argoarchaeum ethanivorans]|uniref:Diadenylate cyclase n=1 Tax=Candidatus Argoarchaeum ethanivorans TaxID=2608793 RepID=A0A811TAM2_9EURY|nr:MAG: DisA bacterial checkpoint controller nucleotide-binding protein [Candidatus Argoarchaeum ethanivorans]
MKYIEPIIKACIDIAKSINAPIICLSDLPIKTDDVPVIIAENSTLKINKLMPVVESDSESGQFIQILKNIESHSKTSSEQISDAAVLSYIGGLLKGDYVVGIVEIQDSVSIVVHDLTENKVINELLDCGERVDMRLLLSVMNVAFDIATFGREGVPIGCAFVIGDVDEVMRRSHQLVLNPYYGHKSEERDVLDPYTWEALKEFVQLDGVIVIDDEGLVVAAGRYLDVDAREISIKQGLGARHAAIAAITRDTQAVGVAVSQTGGVVRVFKDGIAVVEINSTTKIINKYGIDKT